MAWQQVKDSQNIADFDQFIRRYPSSEFRTQVEDKLEVLYWNRDRTNGTQASLRDYMDRFPNGRHSQDAKDELAKLDWASVASSSNPVVLEDFTKRCPSGVYHDKAMGQLDGVLWAHTRADDAGSLQAYLQQFPKGKHAEAADSALAALSRPKPAPTVQPTITADAGAGKRPVVDDRAAVRSTLEEYKKAYDGRDLVVLQRIWPTMSPQQTKANRYFFKTASSIELKYQITGDPEIADDHASVHFMQQVSYVASGKSESSKGPVAMTLKKALVQGQPAWQIESIIGK